MDAPYGIINPNSQNQRWSRWTFVVLADLAKMPSRKECEYNAAQYFRKLWGSVGRGKVRRMGNMYAFTLEIEGPPVHDPEYRTRVKRDFIGNFMFKGFGYSARLIRFRTKLLAGSRENGTPADQLLVLPKIKLLGEEDG